MNHRVTHLLTALLAALAAALLLAACSPKPLEERDLVSKLRRGDAFLPGEPKIESYEILSRSTDKKKGTDTLTVTVRTEDPVETELTYVLVYTATDDSWRLTSVERAEDGPWTLEGPSRRALQSAARERDDFLQEHPDADVTVKTTSETDGFGPEDGTYTKALTLSLTAPYDAAVYNATVKAAYTLTEDGWELDRWRTTDSGFTASEAPDDSFFINAVYDLIIDQGLYYYRYFDSASVTGRGEDLEAGAAWAEVSVSQESGGLLLTDIYRVNAVLSGTAWTVPEGGAEFLRSTTVAAAGPEDWVFTDAVYDYAYEHNIFYDDLAVTDYGEDLDACAAWAEVTVSRESGVVREVTVFRVDAVVEGSYWTVPEDGVKDLGFDLTWKDGAFPAVCTDTWGAGVQGGITLESASGTEIRVNADLSYADYTGAYQARTSGTVTATLTRDPDGYGYVFTLDGASGDFFLSFYDVYLVWYYRGIDDVTDYLFLS